MPLLKRGCGWTLTTCATGQSGSTSCSWRGLWGFVAAGAFIGAKGRDRQPKLPPTSTGWKPPSGTERSSILEFFLRWAFRLRPALFEGILIVVVYAGFVGVTGRAL